MFSLRPGFISGELVWVRCQWPVWLLSQVGLSSQVTLFDYWSTLIFNSIDSLKKWKKISRFGNHFSPVLIGSHFFLLISGQILHDESHIQYQGKENWISPTCERETEVIWWKGFLNKFGLIFFRDFQIAALAINAEKKNYVLIIQWLRRIWSALERRCTGYIIGKWKL